MSEWPAVFSDAQQRDVGRGVLRVLSVERVGPLRLGEGRGVSLRRVAFEQRRLAISRSTAWVGVGGLRQNRKLCNRRSMSSPRLSMAGALRLRWLCPWTSHDAKTWRECVGRFSCPRPTVERGRWRGWARRLAWCRCPGDWTCIDAAWRECQLGRGPCMAQIMRWSWWMSIRSSLGWTNHRGSRRNDTRMERVCDRAVQAWPGDFHSNDEGGFRCGCSRVAAPYVRRLDRGPERRVSKI